MAAPSALATLGVTLILSTSVAAQNHPDAPGQAVAGPATAIANRCPVPAPAIDKPFAGAFWNGWGVDETNGRFQPARHAGLPAARIPSLTLKWAFGFPSGRSVLSQPTVVAGRIVIGSDSGIVYALDASSGCTYWEFKADGAVRSAPVIGPSRRASSRALVYVGDARATVYAMDARSGALVWRQKIDDNPATRITAAITLAGGRLYASLSAVGQEGIASDPKRDCCTARGGVVSLDADTGAVIWKRYTITEEPTVNGRTAEGAVRQGPSGASVWNAPTVDVGKRMVYVGTGNAFTAPVADTTDAVLAFSTDDGRLLWKRQLTAGDLVGSPDAPDVDIGAAVILRKRGGRSLLIVGQKSGDVYALKGDSGEVLWKVNVSAGGYLGGIEWGMAADNEAVYVPVSDVPIVYDAKRWKNKEVSPEAGRLIALRLDDGKQLWMRNGPNTCKGQPGCHPGKPAAISAIPGAVFAGSMDGWIRAHSTVDGRTLWEAETLQEFKTVNGVTAKGGSLGAPGPTIAGGMLFVGSGYASFGMPGNVLLAFGTH